MKKLKLLFSRLLDYILPSLRFDGDLMTPWEDNDMPWWMKNEC